MVKIKKVVLVWGGWTCTAGYIHWAYVAEYVPGRPVNTEIPGCEKIGTRLYDAPNREEISDPKNCRYGKKPEPYPIDVCRQWIRDNDCKWVADVKMRTD